MTGVGRPISPRAATGDLDELRSLAARLGVATSYIDVDQVTREASPATLRAVCDLLLAGRAGAASGPEPFDEVVLVRGGRVQAGVAERAFTRPLPTELDLHDGGTADLGRLGSIGDLQRALAAIGVPIGIHTLRWNRGSGAGSDRSATLLVAPRRFPLPARTGPGLALFAPVSSLWTEAEPLPSYLGLAELARAVSGLGVDTIATLPLYAPGLDDRFQSSPYSPVSRFHWNELLIPDAELGPSGRPVGTADAPADAAAEAPAGSPAAGSAAATVGPGIFDRSATSVDWAAVAAFRRDQLARRADALTDAERADLDTFLATRPDVASYAAWCAGGAADPERIRHLHHVGQWLAERSLSTLSDRLAAEGVALALDLPVGARTDSWETATHPDLFVAGACIGAPPDTFFRGGQNWGLPPLSPTASRAGGHRVWYDLLHTACRHAGVLRIDHVMQVHRLWWVPDGHAADDGVYVHYPAEELLAVAAIVAERTGTTMVGENLGTVPPMVADLLDDWGLPGMYEEVFTLHGHLGAFDGDPSDAGPSDAGPSDDRRHPAPRSPASRPLATVVPGSWAGIRTHDMPALAAVAAEVDTAPYRETLAAELGRPVGPRPRDLLEAMTARLRSSRALEVVVDLDDALGITAPHNVPGTLSDTNWARRLDRPVDVVAADDRLVDLLATDPGPPGPSDRRPDPRPARRPAAGDDHSREESTP